MIPSLACVRRLATLSFFAMGALHLTSNGSAAQVPTLAPSRTQTSTPIAIPTPQPETPSTATHQAKHNVIIFVADGLRRSSVNPDTRALYHIRTDGVDFSNSHSVFPSVTTANASAIATGHGLGDTGDYGNVIYPGFYLSDPPIYQKYDSVLPFLEDDDVLANMNLRFKGNYMGETTLLSTAHNTGRFNVAVVGKLGPTAIQLISSLTRDQDAQRKIALPDVLIVDDSTGYVDVSNKYPHETSGIPLPGKFVDLLREKHLLAAAPGRGNGYGPRAPAGDNGVSGNAQHEGTLAPNVVQQQWFADVTTEAILPKFAEDIKISATPFILLFWSRDPDGTQHNQGDSLQSLKPGINGTTSILGVRNADHALQQLLDWLDRNPEIKETTDVLVTSDHGFATTSRREIDANGTISSEVSAHHIYKPFPPDAAEPPNTFPPGFLAFDLSVRSGTRLFDPSLRSPMGDSPYTEVNKDEDPARDDLPTYPTHSNALLGQRVSSLDATDARIIVAANGGSDLIYVPSQDATVVRDTVALLSSLDYIDGIFVDDVFCPEATSCPGALPISAVGLRGSSNVPHPTIAVTFKHYFLPVDEQKLDPMQYGVQITDTTLQEGQGNHGALARDQTWNNMAAIGPDFKHGYIDPNPVGNIDITPTIASILGLDMPSVGKLKGRVMTEALATSSTTPQAETKTLVSAPASNGRRTILHYQQSEGVHYYDRACMIAAEKDKAVCPE